MAFFHRHMYALLKKRAAYFRRDQKTWIFTFVLPAFFVLIGLFLVKAGGSQIFNVTLPTYTLSMSSYNAKVTFRPTSVRAVVVDDRTILTPTVSPLRQVGSNPLPYNDQGFFMYEVYGGSTGYYGNGSVTGQSSITAEVRPDLVGSAETCLRGESIPAENPWRDF